MDGLSLAAGVAAVTATAFFGLRSNMLKPEFVSWPDSPGTVRWASFLLSVFYGSYAAAIFVGGHAAGFWEVCLALAPAAYAVLMWWNLYRQSRACK